MQTTKLKNILEAVLLGADRTLTVIQMESLFELDEERPTRDEIRKALHEMAEDYESRGYELKQVASGYRLQVKQEYATWVGRLWEEKPARYTRALLETMALIAYRQPITRGEIEEVRGVSVSSNIIKTLLERDWIKVLGHKDVPGKPSLYGTTKTFLDYFNLKSLDQLPTLAEIKDLESINPELALDEDQKSEENKAESNKTDGTQDADNADESVNNEDTDNQQSTVITAEMVDETDLHAQSDEDLSTQDSSAKSSSIKNSVVEGSVDEVVTDQSINDELADEEMANEDVANEEKQVLIV